MITYEQASAAQMEAETRAERQLGIPIGSGLTPYSDGWAVKLYVQGRLKSADIRADITRPIRGVPVVVHEIAAVRLQAATQRHKV